MSCLWHGLIKRKLLANSGLAAGADFPENSLMQIIFIALAKIYVVIALKALDVFWPKQTLAGI